MATGSNYDNPFAKYADENEIYRADLATDFLVEGVLRFLPPEQRKALDTPENREFIQQYVAERTEDPQPEKYTHTQRRFLFDHIIDWKNAQGIDTDRPTRGNFYQRFTEWLGLSSSRSRANHERWAEATVLMMHAFEVRSHTFVAILRASHGVRS